jgi:hypothetical protein
MFKTGRTDRRFANLVRAWWALRCQKRRRRETIITGPAVPAAPSSLQGHDIGGAVDLIWSMAGVVEDLGCSVEARIDQVGFEFDEVGTTGPGASFFSMEIEDGQTRQFRVRAFNAAGYSDYSNVVTVSFL